MPGPHWLIPETPYASYDEYLHATGEHAVAKARELGASLVIDQIKASGLRGRGGAGFPTGTKWHTLANHACETRFVVCNAAEGEPGTFKDRYLLRKNPYATIEGTIIAAHVIGAERIFIALKSSFRREIDRIHAALREMHTHHLLEGLRVTIVEGPEEYLFGEEKGLLNVIEGVGPLPRESHYPPYELGLFATHDSPNPALMNNAETFAHVPGIVRHGAASFRELGTSDTPGTLIYTISGDVSRPGVYEGEAGLTLENLFNEIAGGPRHGRPFKAALSGVANRVVPAGRFSTQADFASLHMIGSGLGSAGFTVFDETTSMVQVAQMGARFLYVESCNQCTACKHGLGSASRALDAFFDSEEPSADLFERVIAGAEHAPQGNRCYLPVQGALMIPSILKAFKGEFDEQLSHRRHPSSTIPPPKIADYDEAAHSFSYDRHQPFKNPDWSYSLPKDLEAPKQTSTQATEPGGPISVRLAPDVAQALRAQSESAGRELDDHVNEALREWLNPQRD